MEMIDLEKQCKEPAFIEKLAWLYGPEGAEAALGRCGEVLAGFVKSFGTAAEALFSAPGRTEVGGNHTDHQHGNVLAAAVDLDILAAVAPNQSGMIRVQSQGYPLMVVDLADLRPKTEEENTTAALIRGVAARMAALGCPLQNAGLDVYMTSTVPGGSGLSSSAAFEVLMGTMLNDLFAGGKHTPVEIAQIGQYAENVFFGKPCGLMDQTASSVGGVVAIDFSSAAFEVLMGTMLNDLFWGGKCDPVEIAQIGQYAENVFFGKPCGLMDQTASSVGGVVSIDFADTAHPVVEQIGLDLHKNGYALCILNSGAGHADLTDEYAGITNELGAVCAYFGKEVLRDVPEEEFLAALPEVRKAAGDRAVNRAFHVYGENRRAVEEAQALRAGAFDRFLALVRESGRSSAMYLQNVIPTGQTTAQELMVTLALCERILAGRGAVRVHGGGFGGTAQAFVPLELLETFREKTEAVLGAGSCHVVTIRPAGGIRLG